MPLSAPGPVSVGSAARLVSPVYGRPAVMGGNRYVIFYQNGERGPACRRAVSDLWLDELRGHPDPALRPAFRVRVRMKSLAVRMADVFNAGPAYRGPGAWRKAFEAQQRAPGPEVTDMAVSVEAFRGFVRL